MIFWIFAAGVVGVFFWKRWNDKPKPLESFLEPNAPKDTVVLHQFGPGLTVPSISPFVTKLETYLRVAKIPYVNKYDRKIGPKGKLPWIQYNNQVIPDSQQIIEFLNKEFQVDLNKGLESSNQAIGHLIRRVADESLFWVVVAFRITFDPHSVLYRKLGIPLPFIWYIRNKGNGIIWNHGMGRHSVDEVTKILDDDLQAVDTVLGDKQFLFGNEPESVTEYDCALFGQLVQLSWQMPGTPIEENIAKKFPNLVKYCNNMKTAFWADWEDRLLHNVSKKGKSEPIVPSPANNRSHQHKSVDAYCGNSVQAENNNLRERKPYDPEP